MKEEKDSGIDFATIVCCLIIGFGWTISAFFEHSVMLAIAFCVLIVGIIAAYILYNKMSRSTEALERKICKQLDKTGFRYEKKEGDLYVIKNDSHFQIQLADSYNRGIKHLFVLYKFRDDNSDKVTIDGWSRASNVINTRNTNTIFVTLEDHFCCCYQTAIGNSKDFMKEFGQAYDAIGEALDDYHRLYPYLERDYPNSTGNQTSIGFRQSD
jgi:hypothetical protein